MAKNLYNSLMNNTLNYTIIIPVLAYAAIVADVIFRFVNQPKVKEALGKCLLPLSRKIKKTNFILIFLILVFVALLFVRRFQLWVEVVFALIAVMAVDMAVQDYFLQQLNGIYENAIISLGKKILKSNVTAFPTFEYEDDSEDASSVPPNMLKIVTEENGTIYLEFISPEERNEAAQILKHWL
ncbi:MAG: hypothetical protein J6W46_08660 [Spirochaetaceae bacterium]|nr:hypothetical protein [Spirochaetaceae bacterium]